MKKLGPFLLVIGLGMGLLSVSAQPAAANPSVAGNQVEAGISLPVIELPVDMTQAAERSPDFPLSARGGGLFDFEGLGPDAADPAAPADPAGDVGPDHYVQMVNKRFAVYDKDGALISGPTKFSSLFTGFGGPCEIEIDGNGTVLYDPLADRWVLGMPAGFFVDDYYQCFAVSTSPNPTGSYHLYAFPTSLPVNYAKIGVWPDAYYMGTSGFPGDYPAYAFDRESMLDGDPASYQIFEGNPNYMMPADFDGQTPPPANTPGYFYTFLKNGFPSHPPGVDRIEVFEFDVDWNNPNNSTFTSVDAIPISPFNFTVCGTFVSECISQPVTSMKLDAVSDRPMWRLAYRNFGTHEVLVGNFTVDVNNNNRAAIRWFELRNPPSGWELYQEGTHAPDTDHRWMGSIAMDGSGNIALGYSVSSNVTKPSLRFATRLVTDPLNTLQAEQTLLAGGGVQTGFPTWGSFSSMNVDPEDECTFWFTGQYHDIDDGGFNWNTRIGVFQIPSCSGGFEPDFTIDAAPEILEICAPADADFTVTIGSILGYSDPVNLSQQGAPAGTTVNFSTDPVIPPGTSTMSIENTGSAAPGQYPIDVVGTGSSTTYTSTVQLDLYSPVSGSPTLIAPANGATGVPVNPVLSWSAVPHAETYSLQISLNAGFTNIVYSAAGILGITHPVGAYLGESTTHFWRVRAVNVCGNGSYSTAFSFTTEELPPILLVDDDDDDPDARTSWTAALNTLGEAFEIWETGQTDAEPGLDALANFETVLWFTGDRFGAGGTGPAGPGPDAEAALADWLDDGGCFFISSQDYQSDKGTTDFMMDYLGIGAVVDDEGDYTSVSGQNVLAGLGPYTLTFPYDDYTDDLTAGNGGLISMLGNNTNPGGVSKQTGAYKTMFWAFGLEALPTGGRTATLNTFLLWCAGVVPPGAFNKTAPADGATSVSINPTLSWAASTGAASYEYCIDTTDNDACSSWVDNGGSTSVSLSGLAYETDYYWQVRAINPAGTTYANGAATAFWGFTTEDEPIVPPGAFNKTAPLDGATSVSINPTLSWATSAGAASYEYCIDTTDNDACTTTWVDNGGSTSVNLNGLEYETDYFWQIRAINPAGTTYANGAATAFWSFTTEDEPIVPPGSFGKTAPLDGATSVSINPTLSWTASTGAASYEYCIDTTDNDACSTWVSTGGATSVNLSGLDPETTYYWQVRAINPAGTTYANGAATAFWSFTTAEEIEAFYLYLPIVQRGP